jgi:pyridoxal/pyridoxine/pyridoxamine kinase
MPAPEASAPGRVLTIQSHCVRGYVGNKAAVFPLQLLGARPQARPTHVLSPATRMER